jgi:hypothetical protein
MNELKRAAALLGAKGGKAKVPKGFAKMDEKRLSRIAKAAAKKRWATEEPKRKEPAA